LRGNAISSPNNQYSAAEYPGHTDTDLDRLIAEAIEATKPAYQVTPGIEGTIFEL
jgi:hypothetical protein